MTEQDKNKIYDSFKVYAILCHSMSKFVKLFYTPRIFEVKEIEPWQLTYCLYYHSLFATNVAAYTDFDKGLIDERFKIKGDFYKKRKKEYKEVDFSKNKVIGKFELK